MKLEKPKTSVVDDVAKLGDGDLQELYKDLRHLQKRTKCTENTILDVIATFEKHLDCPLAGNLRTYDKKNAGSCCLAVSSRSLVCLFVCLTIHVIVAFMTGTSWSAILYSSWMCEMQ